MCRSDEDCDNGSFCDGEETCEDGSCVASEAPVECAATEECSDMVCDDEVGACVPGSGCPDSGVEEPVVDAGGDEPVQDAGGSTVSGAKSSCSHAVAEPVGTGLLRVLFGVI